jgi:MFS family permease
MMFGIGSALGTILAGELVQQFGWRSVFWFRAPIALLAFSLTWSFPRDTPRGQQRFDAPGAALLVAAIAGLLLTLNQLRTLEVSPWGCIAAGAVTVLSVIGFIRRETGIAQPIIDLRFFRDRDFALITAAHALLNLAGFSIMLLVPFYLDRLGGLSVPASGLALASSPAGIMLAGPAAGWLVRTTSSRRLALIGAAAMALAQIAIGMADEPANIPLLAASMFLQGVGLGLFQVACFDISTATIPREDRGVAGSLVMMTRTVGVVTVATVLMLIFQATRTLNTEAGVPDGAAFLAGFHAAFRVAAALPALVVLAGWWRGWARAPSPRSSE